MKFSASHRLKISSKTGVSTVLVCCLDRLGHPQSDAPGAQLFRSEEIESGAKAAYTLGDDRELLLDGSPVLGEWSIVAIPGTRRLYRYTVGTFGFDGLKAASRCAGVLCARDRVSVTVWERQRELRPVLSYDWKQNYGPVRRPAAVNGFRRRQRA